MIQAQCGGLLRAPREQALEQRPNAHQRQRGDEKHELDRHVLHGEQAHHHAATNADHQKADDRDREIIVRAAKPEDRGVPSTERRVDTLGAAIRALWQPTGGPQGRTAQQQAHGEEDRQASEPRTQHPGADGKEAGQPWAGLLDGGREPDVLLLRKALVTCLAQGRLGRIEATLRGRPLRSRSHAPTLARCMPSPEGRAPPSLGHFTRTSASLARRAVSRRCNRSSRCSRPQRSRRW